MANKHFTVFSCILAVRIESSGLLLVVFINQWETKDFDPNVFVFLVKVVFLLERNKSLISHVEKMLRNSKDVYATVLIPRLKDSTF